MVSFLRPFRFSILGLFVMVAGFLYDLAFAGLPYQDPSAALQAQWEFHKEVAGWILLCGLAVFLSGLAAAPFLRRRHR